MSKYNDEIFKTLTSTEEKFRSAIEIAEHMDRIRRKLIKDYWTSVTVELNKLINSANENFQVDLDEDIFSSNSKCRLILRDMNEACFIYEHLAAEQSFGLWIYADAEEGVDLKKVQRYRESMEEGINGYKSSDWWFARRDVHDDFTSTNSLTRILPDNIEKHSQKRAMELFNFAVENKKHLEYILENCF